VWCHGPEAGLELVNRAAATAGAAGCRRAMDLTIDMSVHPPVRRAYRCIRIGPDSAGGLLMAGRARSQEAQLTLWRDVGALCGPFCPSTMERGRTTCDGPV
jgi:hypothetical protein